MTPANSEIVGSADFPAKSFFDIFFDITIPNDQGITLMGTNGPVAGLVVQSELGGAPNAGSIQAGGPVLPGTWVQTTSVPDLGETWMLCLAGIAVLRFGRGRKFLKR